MPLLGLRARTTSFQFCNTFKKQGKNKLKKLNITYYFQDCQNGTEGKLQQQVSELLQGCNNNPKFSVHHFQLVALPNANKNNIHIKKNLISTYFPTSPSPPTTRFKIQVVEHQGPSQALTKIDNPSLLNTED